MLSICVFRLIIYNLRVQTKGRYKLHLLRQPHDKRVKTPGEATTRQEGHDTCWGKHTAKGSRHMLRQPYFKRVTTAAEATTRQEGHDICSHRNSCGREHNLTRDKLYYSRNTVTQWLDWTIRSELYEHIGITYTVQTVQYIHALAPHEARKEVHQYI